jgi:arylsulfatase
MKGLKGSNDEGGARVPFFVRWTGKVEAGREIDRIAAHIDVLPTLAALAGAPLPEGQVEGRSLLPLLEGKTDRWEDRYLFNHVCRWPTGADPGDFRNVNFSVRNQKYRYVAAQGGGGATKGKGKDKGKKGAPAAPRGPELFDMETDPGQTTNVIDRHPEIAAQMKAAFDHYWTEAIPLMINEKAPMSPTKPYHEWYREQEAAGGIPEWVAPAL